MRWIIVRWLAAAALVISTYLLTLSARVAGPIGCGPNAGCGSVLAGPWSRWFGVPVAALGAGIYLLIFLTTFRVYRARLTRHRTRPVGATLALTAAAALAGAWFTMVQIVAGHGVCAYCLAVHACGALAAAVAWSRATRGRRKCLVPALAGFAVLVAGQVLPNPQPLHAKADVVAQTVAPPPSKTATNRVLRFAAGGKTFELELAKLPTLGSPQARHFIVVMSDYTCEHCRATHRMLEQSLPTFGDEVGVIVLPALLDPACNPCLPRGVTHPLPQDCALARLAMAVFVAQPDAFAKMNEWLFAEDRVRGEAEARAFATQLVGPDALAAAEKDPRVQQIITTGCELFAHTGSGLLPKMLIGSTALSGEVDRVDSLRALMSHEWNVRLPE